ncbi:hypothetical protein MRB53_007376 [Persea americana]|uniref:Uncharacterized protein n=1 Tax=Persea americana TaxID=3435 RepID=A0ACC2MJU8_PERAE|nr:hypothetical protein MRB53_007376 [Persea americana]
MSGRGRGGEVGGYREIRQRRRRGERGLLVRIGESDADSTSWRWSGSPQLLLPTLPDINHAVATVSKPHPPSPLKSQVSSLNTTTTTTDG